MSRSSRSKGRPSNIEDELRWVEDSIPAAPGAALLPNDDVGFADRLRDDSGVAPPEHDTAAGNDPDDGANPAMPVGGPNRSSNKPGSSNCGPMTKMVAWGFALGAVFALISGSTDHSREGVKTAMHSKSAFTREAPLSDAELATVVVKGVEVTRQGDAEAVKAQIEVIAKQAAHEDVSVRQSADRFCLRLEGVESVTFINPLTNTGSHDRDPAAAPFCLCKKGLKATGPGSKNDFDYGPWGVQKGHSLFPADTTCKDGACKCSQPAGAPPPPPPPGRPAERGKDDKVKAMEARDLATRQCQALETAEIEGSILLRDDSDKALPAGEPGGRLFCSCKRGSQAFGKGSIPVFDFGMWAVQKGYSLFPATCHPPACGCGEPAFPWADRLRNLTVFNINVNLDEYKADYVLGNQTTAEGAAKLFAPPVDGVVGIDVVSLTTSKDFRILFDANGMLTWFRHIGSIRSLTFITPETGFFHDIYDQLRKSARLARLRAGAPIPGTDRVVPPIHVIREDYFWKRYRDFYGCPYAKVCQQLMKLHVFDIPNLLDNVLILDSDTSWGADVDFVYPNGSAVIHQFAEKRGQKECDGNDPVNFVNAMLARNDSVPLRSTGKACQIGWCSHNLPFWPPGVKAETADGFRHISHHMLFQRDIMMALHEHVKRIWRSTSIWGSVSRCWNAVDAGEHDKGGVAQRYCTGRVAEYELYWTFAQCHAPDRIIPRTILNIQDRKTHNVTGVQRWEGASSTCTEVEMAKCVELYSNKGGFLLKGCHSHRANIPSGQCLNDPEIEKLEAQLARFFAGGRGPRPR